MTMRPREAAEELDQVRYARVAERSAVRRVASHQATTSHVAALGNDQIESPQSPVVLPLDPYQVRAEKTRRLPLSMT
jgi:hypothetical protein